MVGYSTSCRGETGRKLTATRPTSTSAIISNAVATGRKINRRDMFTRLRRSFIWRCGVAHDVFVPVAAGPRSRGRRLGRRGDLDLGAVTKPVSAVDHDRVAGTEPIHDGSVSAVAGT